jgi:hypothetical protein
VGDIKAGARSARAGAKRGTIRRRAVGTRDRIITHLTTVDEITDPTGMASTRLAEAVGYPGSSVAFAQLLSGMERDGLIVREVRGKRTYRITLPEGAVAARLAAQGQDTGIPGRLQAAGSAAVRDLVPVAASSGFDYDELARRLLVQVVRRLAATSADVGDLDTVDAASALAEPTEPSPASEAETGSQDSTLRETAALQETVAGLERELATAWSRHGTLTAENARLREQLNQAQRDLALERTRRAQVTGELNQAEVVLLERLLTKSGDDQSATADAEAEAERPGATAS